jgi:uncharacterized protein (TIGR03067 family)
MVLVELDAKGTDMGKRLLILAAILALAGDTPKEDKVKDEMAKLAGTWNFATVEVEGNKVPAEMMKGATMVLKDNTFGMTSFGVTYKGTYAIDPSKSPKTLDISFTEGPEKGNKSLGIYELDKDDWKICLGLAGKDRPTEFASKPGSGHVLETLKREKK